MALSLMSLDQRFVRSLLFTLLSHGPDAWIYEEFVRIAYPVAPSDAHLLKNVKVAAIQCQGCIHPNESRANHGNPPSSRSVRVSQYDNWKHE